MKTEGKVWIIFDSFKGKKTKPLSLIQAQIMLLSFKTRDLAHYHIWSPGWTEWIPLTEYLTSEQKFFVQAQPPEPAVKKKEPSKILKSVQNALNKEGQEKTVVHQPFTLIADDEVHQATDYGYYGNEFRGDDLSLSGIPD
ncbi:MAG: hypothetical protein EOP06_17255, partial [Proteobacteria bacterium]